MAERFARDGRLIALGGSPTARSDARHIAVEFVHPVIVGKRALPALALTAEGGALDRQLALLAEPDDIVVGFDPRDDACARALALARSRGCLVVVVGAGEDPWTFSPATGDEFIDQELGETIYHVLWELVHVFLEHRGLLAGRTPRRLHDAGASAFLYPSLGESEDDLEAVVAEVCASIGMKAEEVIALREQTLGEGADALMAGARALRAGFEAGGRLLAPATAARQRTRWMPSQTSVPPPGPAGGRAARSISPRTRGSSRRSPTTSASRRCSRAR